jgi:CDP-diacylglycerol--glycerol-3-phosphate 3-phosphatidyltransferase
MLAGFLFSPTPDGWLAWIPAILYSLERLIDFGDGYVARITQRETRLGEILDIEFDGLGILIAVGLAIQYDKLPAWYLLLGLGRPLFVFGMWLRRRWHKPVYDLPPSEQRRVIAGFQTGFVSLTLWPVLSPTITMLASYLFAIPLVFSFGRDWLVVSGAIDASSAGYQSTRQTFKRVVEGWLPLAARVAGTGLAFALLGHYLFAVAIFGLPALGALRPLLLLLAALWGVAAMLMLFGIAGRTAAAALLAFACFDILNMGLNWENGLLLACTIIVAHLGSGRFALWQPEERFLHAKLGTPRPTGT